MPTSHTHGLQRATTGSFGIISPDGDTVQTFEPTTSPTSASTAASSATDYMNVVNTSGTTYSIPEVASSDEPEEYYTADTTSTDNEHEQDTPTSPSVPASDLLSPRSSTIAHFAASTAAATGSAGSTVLAPAANSPLLTAEGAATAGIDIHVLPRLPKLARSASLPVPASNMAHLDPPLSPLSSSPSTAATTPAAYLSPSSSGAGGSTGTTPYSSYDEVSRELADSVQAIVQTLLHLAPPHILDPVKELFSACTVQLPTPSVSALLTTMKNLNYLSANLRSLDEQTPSEGGNDADSPMRDAEERRERERVKDNFDIGEVVQSVGDVLSGVAAQAGVDLAIFHGDVGMRHINVMGDERSILFILTHITRQILSAARSGDAIEIGLHLTSVPTHPRTLSSPNGEVEDPLDTAPGEFISPALIEVGTPIACSFAITHKASSNPNVPSAPAPAVPETIAEEEDAEATPNPNSSAAPKKPQPVPPRPKPRLDSILIKRLLTKTHTTLAVTADSSDAEYVGSGGQDTTYTLSTQFVRGPAPTSDPQPPSLFIEDDESPLGNTHPSSSSSMPPSTINSVPLAKEPTLEELATFSETALRGKRAVFHARESSTFARHLTSYLTSWGLDVGHVPIGLGEGGGTVVAGQMITAMGSIYTDGHVPSPVLPAKAPSDSAVPSTTTTAAAGAAGQQTAVLDPTSGLISPSALLDPSALGGPGTLAEVAAAAAAAAAAGGAASNASTPTTEGGGGVPPSAPVEASFVIIDDDVDVLRRILNRYRPEAAPLKRPSLAAYHRPRSSPQIQNVLGIGQQSGMPRGVPGEKRASNLRTMLDPNSAGSTSPADSTTSVPTVSPLPHLPPLPSPLPGTQPLPTPAPHAPPPSIPILGPPNPNIIIVHITSLARYKQVKDTVQSALFLVPPSRMPDIMVVPKPAGPRRFLTALYTAVRRPMVDPWFSPIATSPQSPGGVAPVSSSLHRYSSGSAGTGGGSGSGSGSGSAREPGRKSSTGTRGSGGTSPTATRHQGGSSGTVTAGSSPGDWHHPHGTPHAYHQRAPSTVSSSSHAGTPQASPMSAVDSIGYFASPTVPGPGSSAGSDRPSGMKVGSGSSASSGVVIQSPDGRPTGIYFQPHQRGTSSRFSVEGGSFNGTPGSERGSFSIDRSGAGTPRSGRAYTMDVRSTASRTSSGSSVARYGPTSAPPLSTPPGEDGPARIPGQPPLLRERRSSNQSDVSPATTPSSLYPRPGSSASARKQLGGAPGSFFDDDTSTPTLASFPTVGRSGKARKGSSRSRPTSAGSSRDGATPGTAEGSATPVVSRGTITGPANALRRLSSSKLQTAQSAASSSPDESAAATPPALSSTNTITQTSATPKASIDAVMSGVNSAFPASTAGPSRLTTPTSAVAASPLDHAPAPTPAPAPKKKPVPAKNPKPSNGITPPISVLIAEDNPINQSILTTFMRRKKLKYATANNGQEAVEKWRTGQYHLILMDIQMPVMDGIDATKEIRRIEKTTAIPLSSSSSASGLDFAANGGAPPTAAAPSTPFHSSVIIVALTASSLQSDRVKALAAGCNDFLTKPVSLHWLDKKIIEWGSIKALQMWASPELTHDVQKGQDARAKAITLQLPPSGHTHPSPAPPAPAPALPPAIAAVAGTASEDTDGGDTPKATPQIPAPASESQPETSSAPSTLPATEDPFADSAAAADPAP